MIQKISFFLFLFCFFTFLCSCKKESFPEQKEKIPIYNGTLSVTNIDHNVQFNGGPPIVTRDTTHTNFNKTIEFVYNESDNEIILLPDSLGVAPFGHDSITLVRTLSNSLFTEYRYSYILQTNDSFKWTYKARFYTSEDSLYLHKYYEFRDYYGYHQEYITSEFNGTL
ncbi:hypothetical protein [Aureispira sp. CCB-E]|uniref:hypothetical protein n=1 Tax=Aureispira sp. CCB-E TaxID=3051121 RepID=UPI0028692C69|nr:hypothetical protein [Aureispira sp. CCB-E]WMX12375.1 hypothetical protein QP953_16215 [Aureispira sp. CCB-E]